MSVDAVRAPGLADVPSRRRWRRGASLACPQVAPAAPEPSDDTPDLTWLLTFRLDALVGGSQDDASSGDECGEASARLAGAETEGTQPPAAGRKPPYTYTELIERALRERGQLTVSAIYQWISDRYPFYKPSDERWKNSVRHNLSINPHFRKGARAARGAGHLWSLAANALDLLPRHNAPSETFARVVVLDEAALAAASIIPQGGLPDHSGPGLVTHCFMNPVSSEQIVRECGLFGSEVDIENVY